VKELHSSGKFAPIPKGAKLKSRQDAASVPVGTVTVQDQNVGDQHGPCCSRCLAAGCPQENGPQIFGFVSAWLEHSFSQGLKLQQNYGGGIGYILIKDALQELEVKASMNYIDQRFESGSSNSLVGSVFGETYNRKFVHSMLLTKQANSSLSWNDTSAYTAIATAGLTFPIYHRVGFITVGATCAFR
jgi:uncharacterized protein DUF481